jgi:DNA-binding response OmpR family regulator
MFKFNLNLLRYDLISMSTTSHTQEPNPSLNDRPLVLMIDDEPAITESLAYCLNDAGFDSLTAPDLTNADKLLLSHRSIALIILDLSLPDGHGFDWLRQFRGYSDQPVIILSSHDDEIEHIVGLEIGADDFIDKPFSPREVVARVRAVLRRTTQNPPNFRTQTKINSSAVDHADNAEEIVIDYLQYKVFFCGGSLGLSQLEFALFEALYLDHRVHTRAQLLKKAWGGGVSVSERTVDVHITALRKKWTEHDPRELIETVRGIGYRLSESIPPIRTRGQPIQ